MFEQRFEHWLRTAGTSRAELATSVVRWLYDSSPERVVPPLLLSMINEYAESARQEPARRGSGAPASSGAADRTIARLTGRERQVLRLIGEGMSNRRIAATLTISEKTVKNHITSLFAKLGVSARTEALVVAFQNGMLSLDTAATQ